MKSNRMLAFAVLLFATALPFSAAKASTMATLPCPVCHMPMTKMKTAMNPVPLMVHGKKWFCCSGCAAGKAAAAFEKKHHGKVFVAEK